MSHRQPRWISYDTWACFRHIPAAKIPATAATCWYCVDERPLPEFRPPPPERAYGQPRDQIMPVMSGETCAWEGCKNPTTMQSKYCSRKCSNNNARARAAARKEQTPDQAAPAGEPAE